MQFKVERDSDGRGITRSAILQGHRVVIRTFGGPHHPKRRKRLFYVFIDDCRHGCFDRIAEAKQHIYDVLHDMGEDKLRWYGEHHFALGKPISSFFEVPGIEHTEEERAIFEAGWRKAEKEEPGRKTWGSLPVIQPK